MIKDIIGDHNIFLDKLFSQLEKKNIDTRSMFLDHLCYRVESLDEYHNMKEKLSSVGKLLTEENINGRPIASFKLFNPLLFKDREIPLIELPAPKPDSRHISGLEHAEFVLSESFDNFQKKYSDTIFNTKGLAKNFNPELEIELQDCAVKFHHLPLESVIAIEQNKIPPEFCNLVDVVPNLVYREDYYGVNNFVGEKIIGYDKPWALMTKTAALYLQKAALELEQLSLGFIVFDSYRPQSAVEHFYRWSQEPGPDYNSIYYPDIKKSQLFEEGYLAKKSSHSRGSTIDLSLYDLKTKKELDMGTIFDFFHETSHTFHENLPLEIKTRRKFFVDLMRKYNFRNYSKEWWHFTLIDEPYPSIYFQFRVNEFWNN
jgi:D-alanyl-D-alanine dipeptidase